MEYLVINESSIDELIAEVHKRLATGWKLQGGVTCSVSETVEYYYPEYCQAMVKE